MWGWARSDPGMGRGGNWEHWEGLGCDMGVLWGALGVIGGVLGGNSVILGGMGGYWEHWAGLGCDAVMMRGHWELLGRDWERLGALGVTGSGMQYAGGGRTGSWSRSVGGDWEGAGGVLGATGSYWELLEDGGGGGEEDWGYWEETGIDWKYWE